MAHCLKTFCDGKDGDCRCECTVCYPSRCKGCGHEFYVHGAISGECRADGCKCVTKWAEAEKMMAARRERENV